MSDPVDISQLPQGEEGHTGEDGPPTKIRRTRWGQQIVQNGTNAAEPQENDGSAAPDTLSQSAPQAPIPMHQLPGGTFDISAASAAAKEALEKAKKAVLFHKQIREQMANLKPGGSSFTAAPAKEKPSFLKLDKYGREVDDEGRVVPIKAHIHSTLKVNINIEKEQRLREVFHTRRIDRGLTNPEKNKWFDTSQSGAKKSRRKAFRFVEPGTYQKREQQMLQRAQARSLGIDIAKVQRERLQETGDKRTRENKTTDEEGGGEDPTPEMEWWDVPLVERDPRAGLESDFPYIINIQKVTHYVEHPVPIEPILEPEKAAVTTLILTPKERAKLRRRKRQDAEREKQDKIRMGLVPPPPPKVKLSNLMRALGEVAASDPSK
eukprot:Selendium_serpulae@DN5866_c0_g2_i1.p1